MADYKWGKGSAGPSPSPKLLLLTGGPGHVMTQGLKRLKHEVRYESKPCVLYCQVGNEARILESYFA